ncbi:hypothetical protein EDD15DRAFT_2377607 [Pisolithus albus]|nr:hypothetical protein EDD15DRAFT_2377607 [Pisolithus albus]
MTIIDRALPGEENWNFHNPSGRTISRTLVGTIDESVTGSARLARSDTYNTISEGTVPLVLLVPIILPFAAGLALAQWAYETYQQVNNEHRRFMAYIVDLIHVLEILFTLTSNDSEKKLTRRAIEFAFNAYHNSNLMQNAHAQIKAFDCKGPGRDVVLEKVVSLVWMSRIDDVDLIRAVRNIPRLERDEEWHTDDDGRQAR